MKTREAAKTSRIASPSGNYLASRKKKQVKNPGSCALPNEASVMDLAQFYCAEPESALEREDLLETSRIEMSKYELDPEELDRIVPVLARTLHMLVEQNGGKALADERKLEIERQVLDWCGGNDDETGPGIGPGDQLNMEDASKKAGTRK